MSPQIPADTAYVEFAACSNFSFLRAASKPEEMVSSASLLGHRALGLADRNTVAGVVRAWSQSKHILHPGSTEPVTLPFHPGCRLVFSDGTPDILAYPRDRKGWGHLCRMLTVANERGEKGNPDLRLADFFEWGDHMSLAILPDLFAAPETALAFLRRCRERFGPAARLAAAPAYGGDDMFRLTQAAALAQAAGLPLMAVNDALYHSPMRRPLQDVLTAIRMKTTVAKAGFALSPNAERHLKPPAEMARLFRRYPQALAETIRFAGELAFSLDALQYNYPDEPIESGLAPQEELERLTWEGAAKHYRQGIPEQIKTLIRHELGIVADKNYARYFLTVLDIVNFARSRGILCQGRGSAANSVICYCIGLTAVDPHLMGVQAVFERFISTEREEPPDIDVDFEHDRRDEVMAYVYETYSHKRTALAAAVISYRGRSALREVAKAMGLSQDVMAALSSSIWGWSSSQLGEKETGAAGLDKIDPVTRHVIDRANDILGFPRHLTQHVGGFVITRDRLDEMVPVVRTAMEERRMVEWDKDDLDAVKMIKVDVLALGMLSCLRRCFDLQENHYLDDHGERLTLDTIPKEEEDVYDMICRADTIGVFQIESRAQMSMLPRLKPRCFYDLVIEVAIVRPGPIQGDMVHPYLRRREGKDPVDYPNETIRQILVRTLGVPLFQEQAMKIAIEAGGFSPGEADQLRRAMATFKRTGTIKDYEKRMIDGMVQRGYDLAFAQRCFNQIKGFAEYGFPEAHAASFALLVYASAWFKTYYPDIFCAALVNSQPMGFYAPGQLVRDAREHGVEVRNVDINLSDWDCTLEAAPFDPGRVAPRHAGMRGVIRTRHAMRLGFRQVKGLAEDDMKALVDNRGKGYESVRDLWLRSGLKRAVIERLAEADAFRSLDLDRRAALWAARGLDEKSAAERLPLFEQPGLKLQDREPHMSLPAMPAGEHVIQDYRTLSLSLKAHPVSFLRKEFDREKITPSGHLTSFPNGRRLSVAGLVLVRQRPGSAKGVIFMTLEDEEGIANVIVWKKTFDRFRSVVMGARLVRVDGRLQSASGVIHIVAERITDLTPRLAALSEGAARLKYTAPADEGGHDGPPSRERGRRNHPPDRPDAEAGLAARRAGSVMPKGRNFH
ncbi:MAG TPA: error-prone DNA polymerase [Rhizobiaceae bacterium]|nr:error-prone DNA polymerase [Rhizobiaceae bacterium]